MSDEDKIDENEAVEINEETEQPEVSELDALKEQNEKLRNEFLYLRAEFDNFRKKSIKERSDLIKFGPERMANSLLNIVDIFEKALSAEVDSNNLESFVNGIKMTSEELTNTLSNFGVKAVESIGQAFDPNVHEALGSEESDEVPEGHVVQVFKKPYKFHDKVMRHGQVIIATKKTSTQANDDDEIIGFE